MNKLLDNVNNPKDLKKLSIKEKQELAREIREVLLNTISKNGGHLASNLGIICQMTKLFGMLGIRLMYIKY